ncbi:hypothetical protein FOVG_16439 [Fusarium oxysporum f. sp. pisi HDV247]|uniref:Uncharacterized protein n=1 Tax=Fusarium oxysporum f. sp. pisi HDV247 TaxID=1080344 RepID=W9NI18_FUSOX|nr:hypothetical protein FOVG_16439 [Fusarium oxysporum f. sp. pisi HDV247]
MTALGNIQKTLDSLQDKQQQQTNIAIIGGSLTSIKTWQTRYATATKFNNTSEINTLINEFNENAPTYITKIFNVLNGQGLGPGTAPLLKSWHAASYAKMYTPVNGQYAFTLRNYLDDYNSIVSWVISMAALAAPTMSASYFQGEADQYTSDFQTNATAVLGVAYDQFPPFVKKFKPNYTDVGPNLNQWFRMWYNETHVKNYIGWRGSSRNVEDDQNYGVPQFNAGNNEYQLYPLACDDDEGIYPAVEFVSTKRIIHSTALPRSSRAWTAQQCTSTIARTLVRAPTLGICQVSTLQGSPQQQIPSIGVAVSHLIKQSLMYCH